MTDQLTPPGSPPRIADHPRPLLRRDAWWSLDGEWAFSWDPDGSAGGPDAPGFEQRILVPFAPETPASGLGGMREDRACWYRRTFEAPALAPGRRLLLRFGAVDHAATVWVNGVRVADHEGGYTPFAADITDVLEAGEQVVVVRAEDDPRDLERPRGKQEWGDLPHGIWYPRTTGIWQSVWLEAVGEVAVGSVRWRADVPRWALELDVELEGARPADAYALEVAVRQGDVELGRTTATVHGGSGSVRVALPDPGIGDRRRQLWSPEHPVLLDAELVLHGPAGELDRAASYTAMRTVGAQGGRFLLNGRPRTLRLVLDQGYWPETGLTPPGTAALERDVELAQALGFNGVRKHQKVEDPRFLRIADERGLLVWSELPSAQRFTPRAAERLVREWTEVVRRDASHPCVVAWVPFNESWGIGDVATEAPQRELMLGLAHLTRALDPTRPVVANDGWEAAGGDLLGIHDYDTDPVTLGRRYAQPLDALLAGERPCGQLLLLDGEGRRDRPVLLTEFGGIALTAVEDEAATWGYDRVRSGERLAEEYEALLAAVHAAEGLAGFCWTQLTDTYQEANGLLTMDREPKAPLARIAAATRGPQRFSPS